MTVTYPDLPSGGAYSDLHVLVQTSAISEANQGKWPYGFGKTGCTISGGAAKYTISVQASWRACNLKLYIGVHASFSLDGGSGDSGWMKGPCISTRPNCPKYFEFTTECKCPVVTTYEPYTTSLVYTRTIYETSTVTCSTVPDSATGEATCTNPNAGATQTVAGKTSITDFACASPV